MSDKEEVSLHDEIKAAFAATNAKVEDEKVDNTEVIDTLEGKDEAADKAEADKDHEDAGDPALKADDKTDPAPKDESATEEAGGTEVKLTESKAPSSWSPKVREKWNELPEEVRSEIIRREEASVNGVRQLQNEFAPIRQFAESISPFLQEAAQQGQDPSSYVRNVLIAERNLRNPDHNARFEALLGIADSYGIPLRQALNQAAGKELLPVAPTQPQLPPEVMRELQAAREFRESMQSQTIEQQVESFKTGKEFFNDVRATMADLMDAGIAKSLDDAYDKACKLHPEVSEVLATRARSETSQQQQNQRRAAAAGASVTASGAADITVDDGDDDSIEATVRKAFVGQSGRV